SAGRSRRCRSTTLRRRSRRPRARASPPTCRSSPAPAPRQLPRKVTLMDPVQNTALNQSSGVDPAEIRSQAGEKYKYGFVTEIESERAPKGLDENTIRFIS